MFIICFRFFSFDRMEKKIKILFDIFNCNMYVLYELFFVIWLSIIYVNVFYWLCFLEFSFVSLKSRILLESLSI